MPETDQRRRDSAATGISAPDSAKIIATPLRTASDSAGPRLIRDSSATEPVLELHNGGLVLRLPLQMAQLLDDSLPGFAPFSRSRFDTAVVSWINRVAEEGDTALAPTDSARRVLLALSVVVGDFNGDGKRDVAMEGEAGEVDTRFFLLTATTPSSRPTLISFGRSKTTPGVRISDYLTLVRPGKIRGFEEPEPLDLRTDAVELTIFEKASEIYYLDHGVVRIFATSD